MNQTDILTVRHLNVSYGESKVLFDVEMCVKPGQVVACVGRNGAGKSTLLKSIAGFIKNVSGTVTCDGESLLGIRAYDIAKMGIKYIPQDKKVFSDLTVRENLEIAAKDPVDPKAERWTIERIYELFPILRPLDDHKGGYLSGGEQQMLTISRTLMGNPSLMLLDEPVEGLAPMVVQELTQQVQHLKTLGLSILFAEQNIEFAAEISDRAYVIEGGRVRYAGTMADLENQPEIKAKYLMI